MDSYEKKYKEALERAKAMIKVAANQDEAIGFANTIFPELKESEDERIRKELLEFLDELSKLGKNTNFDRWSKSDCADWICWLEKQGEQNKNYKTMIVKFICKKDWHGIGNYYYGKKYNGYPCEKEQKGYDIYDDNHVPTFCDEDFIDEYFNIVTEEKQGEQKPVFEIKTPEESLGIDSATYNEIVDECIYGEQKSTDKVKPKFKVGDWIVQENIGVYKVIEVCESWYEVIDGEDNHYSISFDNEYMCHLWDITKDAKDGDVLATGDWVFIFERLNTNDKPVCYCHYDVELGFAIDVNTYVSTVSTIKPATKEQRDTLEKAMANAGYTFDFEKKELKKIEQKPAEWSEEDEQHIDSLSKRLDGLCRNEFERTRFAISEDEDWLKSLRQRIGG